MDLRECHLFVHTVYLCVLVGAVSLHGHVTGV